MPPISKAYRVQDKASSVGFDWEKVDEVFEKIKEKEKLSPDIKTLNEIKEIGKKMEDSISEYLHNLIYLIQHKTLTGSTY